MGVEVLVVAFDPVIDATKNLLDDKQFSDMCDLAGCEDAFGALGGPPCSTFSRIRHVWVPGGPRPLRSRDNPLELLLGLTPHKIRQCDIGTALLLRTLILLAIVGCRRAWPALEHPQDPGRAPFPSIWCSWALHILETMISAHRFCFDQCMWGAPSVKPTAILSNDGALSSPPLQPREELAHRSCWA